MATTTPKTKAEPIDIDASAQALFQAAAILADARRRIFDVATISEKAERHITDAICAIMADAALDL